MSGLIYNQRDIPREKWRYGLRSSAATGCGWIACYNALRLMDDPADPEELIRYFEHQVPLLHGNAGTLALAPVFYFRSRGFRVEKTSVREKFDALAAGSDVCLMFYYWRRKLTFGAHFVALRYRDGRFVGYNTFRNSVGPDDYGPSLEAFLKKQGFFGPVLIGIRKTAESAPTTHA